MSLMNIFKRQLSQVIQWQQTNPEILWEKYQSNNNDEIKNASKLIISAGQGCVLVYEGKIVDILGEGIFNLQTDNHPFITNLLKLRTQFESEHKLSLYFYRTTQQLNQSWGTAMPVKYQDPVYEMPVEVGLNGNLSFHLNTAKDNLLQIFGHQECYSVTDVKKIIVGRIPEYMAQIVAEKGYSYTQIDRYLNDISQQIFVRLNLDLSPLGIQLADFKIMGTVFDSETQKRINKVADIATDVLAAEKAGITYAELERLRALRDLAQNEGSGNLAGVGMEMGMGLELAKQFGGIGAVLSNNATKPTVSAEDITEKLRQLKTLYEENLLTEEEYNAKKIDILNQL